MAAKSIVEIVFGIGFVLAPAWLADLFGMTLDEGGTLMARLFGTERCSLGKGLAGHRRRRGN